MALGYCSKCGALVPIRAGARHHPSFRSRSWWPLPHVGCAGDSAPAGEVEFPDAPVLIAKPAGSA